jgi:Cupin-like domain
MRQHLVAAGSWAELEERLDGDPHRPVRIRGGVPASWSWEAVRRAAGELELAVDVAADGLHTGGMGPYDPALRTRVRMQVAELLDRIERPGSLPPVLRAGESCYGYQLDAAALPALAALLPERPPVLPGEAAALLWISGPPGITPPHTDGWVTNLFVQLAGRKTLWLWDPARATELGIRPYGEIHSRQMAFDPAGEVASLFDQAGALVADLEAGDAVWIPEGWVHAVRTDTLSASVSYWGSRRTRLEAGLVQVVEELRSLPPPLKQLYLHLLRWPESVLDEGRR